MVLWRDRVLTITYNIDWNKIKDNIIFLHGSHNFTAFCASGCGVKNKVCNIKYASIDKISEIFIFNICADRFIYKMVRSIVGTLIGIGRGKIDLSLDMIIQRKDRRLVGDTAPAQGLVLDYVTYKEV